MLRAVRCLGLILLAVGAAGPAAAQSTCATGECHATLLKGKNVHPATEDCATCHEATAEAHPRKGAKTFKLTGELPGLCTACHDEPGKKKQIHAPVKDGECTTCHDPHASDQDHLLAQPVGDLCQGCHSDQTGFQFPHGPAATGDCTACHTPHESDVKPLLAAEGDALCFGCHSDMEAVSTSEGVHPALAMGCTSCHNPHGSAHPRMLADEGPALCAQCHDIGKQAEAAAVKHAPVASKEGCTSCHAPHASANAKLLVKPEKDTCLGCHKSVITRVMTTLHGPIAEGRCTACHQPHGSANSHLLAGDFPALPYVPYTGQQFGLCFTCHSRDLVKVPDTASVTGFRNGTKNLHTVHVADPQKGRSCALCHDVHGSAGSRLIAESVPFGQWRLPLRFEKTETGGGCAPGCHRPYTYDRQTPRKNF